MLEQDQSHQVQTVQETLRQSAVIVQNIPSSNIQTEKEAIELTGTQIQTATGYAVITNDIAMSNLIVVTSFGLAIVVITTKARAVERS